MINSNELRIGNLVINPGIDYDQGENKYHDPDGDVVCAVEAFSKEYIELKEVVSGVFLEEKHIDQCLPIPLSPEWLERCGFIYNAPFYTKRPLVLSKNTVRDGSGDYDGFILRIKIEDGMQHMVIKYLHQLQNLYFALTGEELTVNLP